ncbi:hypothetical protein SEPCBS57363_003297 [Sporothrix epigloea]|uniref:Tuberous sclerosis 1 n=1 Tax=Sporothrix epigloea TaxID=1892477 RepID=A0ABP0DKP2_9PEZI
MSSPGSTRDLLKAIQIFTVSPKLPLPDDLSRTIDAYLDKHSENDQATSDRLQESLQATFAQSLHSQHPICYASFLAVLRQLRPAIRSTAHIMQWWEKLVEPLFDQLGDERTPSAAVISDIGEFLFPDEEDDDGEESWASIQETSKDAAPYGLGLRLLQKWMVVYQGVLKKGCSLGWTRERPIQDTLMLLGKRKPKASTIPIEPLAFFLAVNDFFIQKDYRTRAISLLSEFIRSQPPHLYLIVKSPLFDSLLRCLQIDTSTTVISLALTCLTMLLPNMPGTIVPYLAALFNIYARILFWDREQPNADDLEKPISSLVEQSSALRTWEKCTFLTDIDGIAIPHLLGYFNILYGLYPLNFMDYIRKPQRYLRHANAQDTDEVEIQPSEMRDRSEKYRQCHMLHPNFFSLTIDSEKTDFGRWIRSAAADVVAECVSLQISVDEMHPSQVDSITQRHLLRAEVPIFLQGSSTVSASVTTAAETAQNQTIPEGAQLSALTGPASLSSSSQHPLAVLRRTSEASQPCDLVRRDSTNISHTDSPTLGPMLSQNNYNADVLSVSTAVSDYSADGKPGLYQAPANNSVPSLALSHQDSIPEQIRSPSRTSWHLPSLSAPSPLHLLDSIDDRAEDEPDKNGEDGDEYVPGKNVGPITEEMMVKMLRQILLMKSDLNFERYMVQQHLSHIGALRRSNIRQAVTEAETQRLILANRTLKQRLEDAKKSEAQVKKEAEMSRNMSKNWGDLLSNKLKKLHTEHKTWTAEKEGLERDLQTAKEESEHLLVLVCKAEVRELKAKQDMQMLEGAAAEMEKLKEKVKTLEAAKRESQKLDTQLEQSQERSAKLENALEMLQMKLEAREDEFSRTRLYYQQQILSLNSRVSEALHGGPMGGESPIIPDKVQAQVVNALAASRAKYIELQKSHVRLTRRFNKLLESTWHEQTVYTANDGLDAHHMSTLSDADMEAAGVFRTSPIAMRGSSATSSNAGGSVGHRRRQRGVSDAASHETVSPTSRTVPMSVSLGSAVSSPGSTSPQAERYHNRATSGFTNPLRQDRKDSKKPEESRDKRDRTSSGSGIRGMRGFA